MHSVAHCVDAGRRLWAIYLPGPTPFISYDTRETMAAKHRPNLIRVFAGPVRVATESPVDPTNSGHARRNTPGFPINDRRAREPTPRY